MKSVFNADQEYINLMGALKSPPEGLDKMNIHPFLDGRCKKENLKIKRIKK